MMMDEDGWMYDDERWRARGGCCVIDDGRCLSEDACWMLYDGHRMMDAICWMQDAGCGRQTLDARDLTMEAG